MYSKGISFFDIVKLTIPVFLGYISAGIAFGIMAYSVGIDVEYVFLMSLSIYAGAGQFLAVGLFAVHTGFFEIFTAQFLLNSRHFFYGLSLISMLKNLGLSKYYVIFGMTDETFAVLKTMQKIQNLTKRRRAYMLITALNHSYWILGGVLGALIGKNIKIDYSGVEFALTALFVVLCVELYKKHPNRKILFLSLAIGLFGLFFLPKSIFLLVCMALALFLLLAFRGFIDG